MENKSHFYYHAEEYVGNLRYSLLEKNSMDDYERYGRDTPTIYEFIRTNNKVESLYHVFIQSFKEQLTESEIQELEKYFYGGDSGIVKVGLYQASREYGGSEEGGWYYTCWYHIETKEMPYDDAIKYIKQVDRENEDVYEHQGKEEARIELYEAQHENSSKQYYS